MSKGKGKVRKFHTVTLEGLDCTPRKVQAAGVSSITAAMVALKTHRAATAAGDEGALNVWRDNDGQWRMEFMRRLATLDRHKSRYKADVLRWLKKWWPKMGR